MENYEICNKNIIIFGIGITGKSSIKALSSMGANVYIYDDRKYKYYKDTLNEIKDYNFNIIEDYNDLNWKDFDLLLKSPGIKNSNNFIKLAKENNIDVVSDIELAYRIWGGDRFIAITGTNGKTTVTNLVSHILNYGGIKSRVAGNIGVSILWDMYNDKNSSIYALEVSSFQLDSTYYFKPKVAVITNITEDHIDWHGSYEEYKKCKFNIFKNQNKDDLIVLNKSDSEINNLITKSRRVFFAKDSGYDAYYDDEKVYIKYGDKYKSFDRSIIKLIGDHNVENIMAAILSVKEYDIDFNIIEKAIETFSPIEHRIEFVTEINNVRYYNDSKGTNVDATNVALKGFKNDIVLIAGGYDKNSEFDELFNNKNIKLLIVFGATKNKIANTANKYGVENIIVKNLEEAVDIAKKIKNISFVLFSPACASWDMYKNYEERGKHFKKLLRNKYD